MNAANLSAEALAYFLALAGDAGNWAGQPLIGGNVPTTKATEGYLTDLKKKGFVTTTIDEGCTWCSFTDEGRALAAANGVTIRD